MIKTSKRKLISASFILMFLGFLASVLGLFQNKVAADSVTPDNSVVILWTLVGAVGVGVIIMGLLGFVLAIAATKEA